MSGARRALERIAVASVSWPPASRVLGWLSDLPLPRPLRGPLIHAYARAYGVDLSEAALPPSDYPSFNAFFDPELNAYFVHAATDSEDNGLMWAYRYKRRP